ncbi:type II and III secretion system protein family protein [Trinickia sp. LjRoot230]|uniref:type II and III secretion system protein family protein n=1 Tax=Trinickia sp. LjRoot230 TaxID=3342288 RepID=UPI003ECC9C42
MNTKRKDSALRAPRLGKMSSAIVVALLGAGLAAAQPAIAQRNANNGGAAQAGTPMQMTISMAAVPAAGAAGAAAAAAQPLRGPNCKGDINNQTNIAVPVGKSTLVQLAEPARNRTLGNPSVVMATLVSPRTLYLVGMSVGTTNMIVQGASGACQIIDVMVGVDAAGLQQSISQLMPAERGIRVSTAAGNLVLGGSVSSAGAAQQAMEIARAYAIAQPAQQSQSTSAPSGNGTGGGSEAFSSTSSTGGIINMMALDSPQQVMLEVKVVEVSKTLMDQMGSALNLQGGFGSWTGALVTGLLSGVQSIVAASKANKLPLHAAIDAQKTDELTKILAEPNLVTISGQEASFLAGGKVFIPIPQSNTTGATTITLQEEEFGVGLKFTPTVLGNGRINLKVAPEVSQLSPTGVTVSATGSNTSAILPLITTRRASTTVQMNDGESFAIGGLISNNITGSLKAFPGLGELPIIGALMRSTSFQQDRTELVFIITPHLVKPLPSGQYPLPTDSFTQPREIDVYATGNMEGRGAAHAKAPPAAPAASTQALPPPPPAAAQTNVPSPAPAPAPTPEPRKAAAPVETTLLRPDTSHDSSIPTPALVATTSASSGTTSTPSTDAQAARVARIEAAATRIAATQAQANTVASTSKHSVRH